MIVKVQVPLLTNEKIPKALIYNADRSFEMQVPAADVLEAMGTKKKAFFNAAVIEDGTLEIHDEVEWQTW